MLKATVYAVMEDANTLGPVPVLRIVGETLARFSSSADLQRLLRVTVGG
jgi:hypothetical protein